MRARSILISRLIKKYNRDILHLWSTESLSTKFLFDIYSMYTVRYRISDFVEIFRYKLILLYFTFNSSINIFFFLIKKLLVENVQFSFENYFS